MEVKKMNDEEKEARELCAFCNFVIDCKDCPRREWPSGKWHKKPRWDHIKCKDWITYTNYPIGRIGRFLCRIGLHKWYYFKTQELKKCMRCGIEAENKPVDLWIWYNTLSLYGQLKRII